MCRRLGGRWLQGGVIAIAVVACKRRKRTLRRRMNSGGTGRTCWTVASRVWWYDIKSARSGHHMRLDVFRALRSISVARVAIARIRWRVTASSICRE